MKPILQILAITFTLSIGSFTYSQTANNQYGKYGIELNNSISRSSWTIAPTFSFRKWNKHTIDIGLGVNIADQWFWPPNPLTGIVYTTAYKFYPVGKEHKLNFYFQYNLKHYMFLSKLNGYSSSNTRHYNEHFMGYGFEVPIGKKFYFNHDFGVGIMLDFGNSNPNIELNGNLKIGFGYKIGQKD